MFLLHQGALDQTFNSQQLVILTWNFFSQDPRVSGTAGKLATQSCYGLGKEDPGGEESGDLGEKSVGSFHGSTSASMQRIHLKRQVPRI